MPSAVGSYVTATTLKARLGITDSTDDTLIGTIADQVNGYIESHTGRVIAPISGTPTRYYDIDEEDYALRIPEGVRVVTTLSIAQYTGAAYTALVATDFYLRPLAPRPGWPYTVIKLSDRPAGSFSVFPRGFSIVKLVATMGWAAIPDEISDVALTAATRAWYARQSGQADIVGTDEMGRPVVSRFFSARDLGTLSIYRVDLPG